MMSDSPGLFCSTSGRLKPTHIYFSVGLYAIANPYLGEFVT